MLCLTPKDVCLEKSLWIYFLIYFVEIFFSQDISALIPDRAFCDEEQVYLGFTNMYWPLTWVLTVLGACCVSWRSVPCTAQGRGRCSFARFRDGACHVASRWWSCPLDPGNFCSKVHGLIKLLSSNGGSMFYLKKKEAHHYNKWKTLKE